MAEIRSLTHRDPTHVGPYVLVGRVGGGGMGTVYLAWQGERPVAVKIIRDELADDPGFRSRFRREVDVLRRIKGRCTVHVLDADAASYPPYILTDYVLGPSLAEHVTLTGPLDTGPLAALGLGLAEALHAIHSAGVVHRDLKPSNVLLASDGPKVIDFGVAQVADATALTSSNVWLGTPGYIAPEQVRGSANTAAADVFAWAATIAFAATGRPPFGPGRADAVLFRVLHEPPNLDGWAAPSVLRELVEQAFSKDPDSRPSTEDLLVDLLDREPTRVMPVDEATNALLDGTWRLRLPVVQLPRTPLLPATAVAGLTVAAAHPSAGSDIGLAVVAPSRTRNRRVLHHVGTSGAAIIVGAMIGTASLAVAPPSGSPPDTTIPSARPASPSATATSSNAAVDPFARIPRLAGTTKFEGPPSADKFTPFLTAHLGQMIRLDARIGDVPPEDGADDPQAYNPFTVTLRYPGCGVDNGCGGTEILVHALADGGDSSVYWSSGGWKFNGFFLVTAVEGPHQGYLSVNLKPLSSQRALDMLSRG